MRDGGRHVGTFTTYMDRKETVRPLLIVDDDEDAHFLLKRALKKIGLKEVQTDSVQGGEEAIAYLKRCIAGEIPFPALVFLDINMPFVNGFEVLSWMREMQLLGCFAVVMLTSSDDPKDVSRAMTLGAHSYLTKPPPPDVLLAVTGPAIKLAAMTPKPIVPPMAVAAEARKIRVMTVDDSAFTRRMTRRILEDLGYAVVEAASGAEAIERCAKEPPDLVLLDLVMAGMGGMDVIARLRERRSNVRIIVVSADVQDATRNTAVRAGALGYITKPLNAEKISAVASAVLAAPPWT